VTSSNLATESRAPITSHRGADWKRVQRSVAAPFEM
jgi:hypothetical protein